VPSRAADRDSPGAECRRPEDSGVSIQILCPSLVFDEGEEIALIVTASAAFLW